MKFKHIPTGKEYTPAQVKREFSLRRVEKDGGTAGVLTIFPKDPARWDEVLLKSLGLERVE